MNLGRTIRIYLDDGSVSGIKHSEIVNWTGQAIFSPRSLVKKLKEWEEAQRPGVYFLFGLDENGSESVYIGEAENVFDRLVNHVANKDFWNEVIFFTSKDENLTKSHVKYLESRLITLAKNANRYCLTNGNTPQESTLPRGDRDAMEEFINNIRILIGTMSHKVLEPIIKPLESQNLLINNQNEIVFKESDIEFYLKIKGLKAKAILTVEGLVVKEGSEVSIVEKESLSNGYKKLKINLQEKNILTIHGNKLIFQEDYLFSSPSQAAAIIVGSAINGRHSWVRADGVRLKQYEEELI